MTDTYYLLGNLHNTLLELDQDALIFIDNRPPSALSSYRGYYSDLAIERSNEEHDVTALDDPGPGFASEYFPGGYYSPGSAEVRIKSPATVGEFVKALELADGAAFEGYKGGQFEMNFRSDIWVSEYGRCDRLRIVGIEVLPGRVDLVTREEEW